MRDREHQVRECAYYLWEAEGRPEGRAQVHWTMAEIATVLLSYLNSGGPIKPSNMEQSSPSEGLGDVAHSPSTECGPAGYSLKEDGPKI